MAAEVSSLASGLNGATTLGVFSSNIPGSFILPRTVDATALLIAEPPILPIIPRQSGSSSSSHTHHQSCKRPIIDVGAKINRTTAKLAPFLKRISKVTDAITNISSKLTNLKENIFQRLGLMCLFPKLLRPFEPIIQSFKCKLGLNEDGFMENPPCNSSACLNPEIEDRPITRDRGLPNLDFMIEDMVSTMDDCFDDMEKVTYGSRVLAKLVDDESCDDPRYTSICQEALENDKVVSEGSCQSPR